MSSPELSEMTVEELQKEAEELSTWLARSPAVPETQHYEEIDNRSASAIIRRRAIQAELKRRSELRA